MFTALLLVLKKTALGLQVRAVSQNRAMARAMGVRSAWVDAMTFGLGSGIAGVAGPCPTFNWGAVEEARTYELVVLQLPVGAIRAHQELPVAPEEGRRDPESDERRIVEVSKHTRLVGHLHGDHFGDMGALFVGGALMGRHKPLQIWGPTGSTR